MSRMRNRSRIQSEINVTPLVDVCLVGEVREALRISRDAGFRDVSLATVRQSASVSS